MTYATTIRSWPAIAVAALCIVATGYVLMEDVFHGAAITTQHILTVVTLVVAVAAGHYAIPTLRQWRLVTGLGLLLLAVVATSYIVLSSGARNAVVASVKAATSTEATATRARAQTDHDDARRALAALGTVRTPQEVRAAMDVAPVSRSVFRRTAECTDITREESATACRPLLTLRQEMAVAIKAVDLQRRIDAIAAELARLPAAVAGTGYDASARVLAAIPGVSMPVAEIERRLSLLMPYSTVVICELAVLVFLGLGLGHKIARLAPVDGGQLQTAQAAIAGPVDPLVEALRRVGGQVESNQQLAAAMGCSEAEASKRATEGEEAGTIRRWRVGRQVAIALL